MKTRIIASKSMKKELLESKTRVAIYKITLHFVKGIKVLYTKEGIDDTKQIEKAFAKMGGIKMLEMEVCGWTEMKPVRFIEK